MSARWSANMICVHAARARDGQGIKDMICSMCSVRAHACTSVPVGGAEVGHVRAERRRGLVRAVALGRSASTASAATAGDVESRPHSLLPARAAARNFFSLARVQLTSHRERPWRTRTAGERARRRSRRYLGEPQTPRGCREPVPGARALGRAEVQRSPGAGRG